MEDLQAYSPEEIILSNLQEATMRSLRSSEQELAHLRELAFEIASEFHDGASFLASLPEHRLPIPSSDEASLLPLSTASLLPVFRESGTRHRILLCRELCNLIPEPESLWQDFFSHGNDEFNPSSVNRISYQKNSYTDAAYELFSKHLASPRAAYTHSFPSVCEDVYNGLSQYCILPLENSVEGRLSSFSRLIQAYDLKIAAVCDIQVGEDKTTRFALLSKNMEHPIELPDLPHYFEFSCEMAAYPAGEDLLLAARFCGLKLIRADISQQSSDRTAASSLHATVEIGNGDLTGFLIYLAMEVPNANPVGLYFNLSGK